MMYKVLVQKPSGHRAKPLTRQRWVVVQGAPDANTAIRRVEIESLGVGETVVDVELVQKNGRVGSVEVLL